MDLHTQFVLVAALAGFVGFLVGGIIVARGIDAAETERDAWRTKAEDLAVALAAERRA